jgi:hypothetical protein
MKLKSVCADERHGRVVGGVRGREEWMPVQHSELLLFFFCCMSCVWPIDSFYEEEGG